LQGILILDLQVEQFIANALQIVQGYAASADGVSGLGQLIRCELNDFTRISRSLVIRDVIAGSIESTLCRFQGLQTDR